MFMVLRMRGLAKANSFLHLPFETVVISSLNCKQYFHDFSASHCSPVSNRPSDQTEEHIDYGMKFDVDGVIARALSAKNEEELFHSLVHDSEFNTVKLTHGALARLLHRFQDDWKSALGIFRWVETCSEFKPLPELYDKLVDILGMIVSYLIQTVDLTLLVSQ